MHSFNIERYQIIMFGSFLIIAQTALLGCLEYVDSTRAFVGLSFLAQVMGGFGAGDNSTASMAIMSSFSKTDREKYLGWIQAANGLGLLAGPISGAILF